MATCQMPGCSDTHYAESHAILHLCSDHANVAAVQLAIAAAEKRGAKAERERIVGMLREEAARREQEDSPDARAARRAISYALFAIADGLESEPSTDEDAPIVCPGLEKER